MADPDPVSIYHFSAFGWGICIAILGMNREASRGLRSLVLEANSVSRTGLFSLNMKMGLYVVPTADSHGSYLSLK